MIMRREGGDDVTVMKTRFGEKEQRKKTEVGLEL